MPTLSLKEVALLKPHLNALLDLAEGRRKPQTDAQRLFVECAKGIRQPVTGYEIAFVKWQIDKPELDDLPPQGQDKRAVSEKPRKKRRKPGKKSGMSAAEAKKMTPGRWSAEEIEAHHEKSGYDKRKVVMVQGGGVSPR
jgi:hypothetical protein